MVDSLGLESRAGAAWPPGAAPGLHEDMVKTRIPAGGSTILLPPSQATKSAAPQSVLDRLSKGPAEPGEALRYEVCEEVGRGGMGRILRVKDADLNRQVAMKVLLQEEVSEAHVKRFIEEAQITGQLEHPNVLPVHHFGVTQEGSLFFTMKFVRGHVTLEDVVERLRSGDRDAYREWSFERRVQVVQQVCHALHYAHQRGVVHRDIKPQNIVLGTCGEVFLVDWGVAKLVEEVQGEKPRESIKAGNRESGRMGKASDTRDGTWLGTPAYMAPEQVIGHQADIDARTDVYSLCTVLYELLSLHYYLGQVGGKMGDLVAAILQRVPVDAENHKDRLNGRVPRSLSRILRKGLAKRPAERFQTARDLERALQGWHEGSAPIVCPGTAIKRGLTVWGTLIDKYPVLTPAITITVSVLLVAWIALSVWLLVRGPSA